ncbi:MAG TPA: quinone-dependent dihydroorotate dehydrogenase [Halothiobacillus sp.]|nr:quinone-dependent dihydroorotate dehydrogenase [Halothiobacillus sp.]
MYSFLRSSLFTLDPEHAHHLALSGLHCVPQFCFKKPREQRVEAMGLTFSHPIGLAAGLDKNGTHIDALSCLGFGFLEIGTVTPRAQPGNPRPRLFRLPDAGALINRMGFNNDGLENFLANVLARRSSGILGLNIGKNFDTPMERAVEDYLVGLRGVHAVADYVTINISSPNTKNLRQLQAADQFGPLLAALRAEKDILDQANNKTVPIVVKIAPDLSTEDIELMAKLLVDEGMDGVIATNTTIERTTVAGLPHSDEAGGLSGRPVRAASTQVIKTLRSALPSGFPLIGVGGIDSGEAAMEKISAGADLLQIYTGFIYQGPQLIRNINEALIQAGKAGRV